MSIDKCYLCSEEITADNRTVEHIILNALGGKLKAGNLICKSCNNEAGHKADAALAKQFALLSTLVEVNRDHGDIPILKGGKTSDGAEYHYDGKKYTPSKPLFEQRVEGDKIHFSIEARSEKEMENILKSLEKKYPEFDAAEAMKHARKESMYFTEPLKYSEAYGGDLVFQAILKTAVSFYIYKTGDRGSVQHLFDMIRGVQQFDVVKPFYPDPVPYTAGQGEILHLLHVEGNKQEGLLYCYVEFFSHHSYLVVLSTDYLGEDISHTYAYDLIKCEEVKKNIKLSINREKLGKLTAAFTPEKIEVFLKRSKQVLNIIDRRHYNKATAEISSSVTEEVRGQQFGHEPVITEEMIGVLSKRIAEEFVKVFAGRLIRGAQEGPQGEGKGEGQ